ncbi:LPD7 domain-containing protein [Morganella psychrotolerans]|uniref:LPD7 domain-containing protein n=1 Tax=Morganella psychrotolerans TaxID=368603 RepID=UPI0039B106C6
MKTRNVTWLAILEESKEIARSEAGILSDGEPAVCWDRDSRLWYARSGTDINNISRWLPDTTVRVTGGDPQNEFFDILTQAGFLLPELPLMDGQRHRVATLEDKNGQKSGVYCGFLDRRPGGWFINFHRADTEKDVSNWRASRTNSDPLQRLHIRAAAKQAHDEAQRSREQQYKLRTDKAKKLYQSLGPADKNHPYLIRKGITSTPEIRQTKNGSLVIPFFDIDGNFRTLQYITEQGDKFLYADAPKQGHFLVVGGDLQSSDRILYAEGYATARSLNLATGYPVVMTIDAGNMVSVAQRLSNVFSEKQHIFLADFDHAKDENKGLMMAEKAAKISGGRVFHPKFSDDEKMMGSTDFNDLHQVRGIREIRRQLTDILTKEKSTMQNSKELDGPQLPENLPQDQHMDFPDMGYEELANPVDYSVYEQYAAHEDTGAEVASLSDTKSPVVSYVNNTEHIEIPELPASEKALVSEPAGTKNTDEPQRYMPRMYAVDTEPELLAPDVTPQFYSASASSRKKHEKSEDAELNAIWVGGPRPGNTAAIPELKNIDCDELISRLNHEMLPDKSVLYTLDGEGAFIDFGDRLEMVPGASSDDEKIMAALLTAAQYYRGRIELTGSDSFKKQAISLIVRHGLDVEMKVPDQQAMLNDARNAGEVHNLPADSVTGNSHEFKMPVVPDMNNTAIVPDSTLQQKTTETELNTGKQGITESEKYSQSDLVHQNVQQQEKFSSELHQNAQAAQAGVTGKVMEFGTAPFKFDENNDNSFFIKLRTKQGIQTFWGKELSGVLRETRVQQGTLVTLTWKGKEEVTIKVPVKNSDGTVIRYEDKQAHRNQWALTNKQSSKVISGTNEGVILSAFDANRFAQRQAVILSHLNLDIPPAIVPKDGLLWLQPNGQGSCEKGDVLSATRPEAMTITAIPLLSRTNTDGEIDLYLVKSDGDYLQGIVKHNGEYCHVLVSLPDQGGTPPMVFNTVSDKGVIPVGCGNGINKSNGTPVIREHVAFKLEGDSNPRIAKLDAPENVSPQLHARLGFDARYICETQTPKVMPAAAPVAQPNEPRPA